MSVINTPSQTSDRPANQKNENIPDEDTNQDHMKTVYPREACLTYPIFKDLKTCES